MQTPLKHKHHALVSTQNCTLTATSWSFIATYLKLMMLGCFSLRRCLISVSFCSRTFLMATSSERNFPRNTAPWAPLPSHCSSEISSNGTSHMSTDQSEHVLNILYDQNHSKDQLKERAHPKWFILIVLILKEL